ncbi:MAG TPA: NPCBM/NEW2 domain-containing protein [Verrucomicrobiae bacterium]|nr:NPCBM/NEW2 domain-containing protein [Verrucomicrobiae bacterium]
MFRTGRLSCECRSGIVGLIFRYLVLLTLDLSPIVALGLTNSLALTPPMGWNDWNAYHCGISESVVTNNAGVIAANGMKAVGYQYIDIDDGWASSRNSNGIIQVYTNFPDGIAWVANYVHSRGLKLGVYTDDGTNTCSTCISTQYNPVGKDPGSYGYEYLDAFTYAAWGADYLKDDNCNAAGEDGQAVYGRMSDGLMKSGRLIVLCLCGGENGNAKGYESWSPIIGNYWRTTGDIGSTFASMISHIDPNSTTAFAAGPGRWNDPDMLEIGNGEFASNLTAAQTHFSMWCIMAAPLIAGDNVTTISPQSLAILTNAEAIAVDQDPAGEQGVLVGGVKDSAEVWSKPLGYDFTTRAVALFNRSTNSSAVITCYWTNLAFQAGTTATVRDLWAHQDLGRFTNSFTATVPAYGTMLLKIAGTPVPVPGAGTNYLSDQQPIYAYTGWGTIVPDKSIGGNSLTLGGVTYPHGIGVNSRSGIEYNLGGVCTRFQTTIGVDNEEIGSGPGSVDFHVYADGTEIYNSGFMYTNTPPQFVSVDVTGVRRLTLGVGDADDGINYDHADWANALVIVTNTIPQLPETPTGLAASPGNNISLTWNNTLAALAYNVKRATVSGGPYTNIATVPATAFTDSNVVSGLTYYYVVSAVSSFGEGSNSTEVAVDPCSPPPVPTEVTTASINSQIVVSWNASPGATTYTVARFTANTPPLILAAGLTATNFTDTTVAGGTTYYYQVAAANACNQSDYAAFVPAIVSPGPPTGLNAAGGNGEVVLNWSAPLGATGYNVKRSTTSGGPYTVIAGGVTSTGYLDLTVTNGTTYYYVVSALNGGGESADSTEVAIRPEAPVTAYWTNTVTTIPQDWNVDANWTNSSTFPDSVGELAVVNASIAAPQTIYLNQTITIGSLEMGTPNGSAAYTIAANGGSLILSDTNLVSITELTFSKGDTIAAPVTITTNLVVINDSSNALTLAGPLTSSGGSVTVGSGTLQVGDGTTNGSLSSVAVADNTTLVFNRSDNVAMSGVISGSGTVAQVGTGVLALSGTNTFSGGVTIQNGTLQVGNAAALGSTTANTIITNGGTLDVNADNLTGEQIVVSGSGAGGNGAIINSAGQQTSALRNVTLAGDTTFGGVGPWNPGNNQNRWDIRAASNSSTNGCSLSTGGHPYQLTKTGGNQISLVAVDVDPALGDIDIKQGLMGWETATSSMGNPASNLIVRAGATLSFYNANTAWNKHFILYGDNVHTNLYNWSGANVVIGPVQLNGDCVFWGGGTSLALDNAVGGSGSLVEDGTYHLILAGTNAYTGNTTINGGTLTLTNNGSISASARLVVNSGGTLDAGQRSDGTLTLAGGQTLTGDGIVNGNVVIGNGAMLAPGGALAKLIFNNDLTLNAESTTVIEVSKSPVLTNDMAQVAGTLTYGGTLVLTNISTNSFTAGDSFRLFNAAGYSGTFTGIVPAIPAVNLAWDTNNLSSGVLSVVTLPTPPPRFGSLTVNGGNCVFRGSNGVPGWPYSVLTSSNLALPVNQWTPMATNNFDGNGDFSITNPLNPNLGQQYYLLQLK